MKTLIVWGLILGIIGFGSFKGLAWYQVNRLLLQLKNVTKADVAIRHGWISSSFNGEVTVHNVEITPFQLRKPLHVDEVVIRFGSATELMTALPWSDDSDRLLLPASMEIEWRDVSLPLTAKWSAYLPDSFLQGDIFGLACGSTSSIGVDELASMGYGAVQHNLKLRYDYDRRTSHLVVSVNALFEGLSQQTARVDLQLDRLWQWPPPEDAKPPGLNSLRYAVEDKSFIRRLALLCTKQTGYSEPEFIQASLTKTTSKLAAAGISISPLLGKAYETFLKGDSVFELIAEPARSVDMTTLPFMSAEAIARTLNYSVKVNRVAIPGKGFLVNAERLADFLYPPPAQADDQPARVVRKASFQPVSTEYANRFTGRKIRVVERSGSLREGILKATTKSRIDIDVSVPRSRGVVLFHIDKDNIDRLWVWGAENLSRYAPVARLPVQKKSPRRLDGISNRKNTTIIYQDDEDVSSPLAEGEYYEIIDVDPGKFGVSPTINDLPVDEPAPE